MHMNLPLAVAYERASGDQKALLERAWRRLLLTVPCLRSQTSAVTQADERARSSLMPTKNKPSALSRI